MGARRDHLAPGLRTHVYRKYVIYYVPAEDGLTIVRVLHGSRDAVAALAAMRTEA